FLGQSSAAFVKSSNKNKSAWRGSPSCFSRFLLLSHLRNAALVLCSLKAVTKETSSVPRRLRRTSPEPGFGPQVELSGGNAGGLLDLLGIGKALPRQGITAEEAPPALLEIEPARSGGNENVMDAWMRFQPGACLKTVVTTEVIRDDVDVASRIVSFNVGKPRDVAFRVARSSTAGQLLAIAHA